MLDSTGLRKKCLRQYPLALRAWMKGESFFPLILPCGRPGWEDGYSVLKDRIEELQTASNTLSGKSFSIESSRMRHRSMGEHSIPSRITFADDDSLFRYLGKSEEALSFRKAIGKMREILPELEDWCSSHVQKIIASLPVWEDALNVSRFFQLNPRPGIHRRELPLPVHTKFIEENQNILRSIFEAVLSRDSITEDDGDFETRFGLIRASTLISFRILDPNLRMELGLPADEMSLPASDLAALPFQNLNILITENKRTYSGLPHCPRAIAMFGSGFQVLLLGAIPWLKNARIRYWGDIDAHGFLILSRLREIFSHVESFLMDQKTWDAFKHFAVNGTLYKGRTPDGLHPPELHLFHFLQQENLRLEQEKIAWNWVHDELRESDINR